MTDILYFALYFVLAGINSFCILYTLFAVMMSVKNNYDYKLFSPFLYYPLKALFVIGYVGDVLWNLIFGTALFLQLPYWDKDQTLTHRLNLIYLNEPIGNWRWTMAVFICKNMLNPLDKHHCGDR